MSEWTGGSTTEDRIEAGQPIELPDFLPNASGLAGALAALHDRLVTHGGINLSAISYSVSHTAKLGAFGRPGGTDTTGDVTALSAALETALTGEPPGGPPPSESIDGFPRAIDRILRSGQAGDLTARDLEKALVAAPTPRIPGPEPRATSRRLLVAAVVLIVFAVGLVALGRVFSGGTEPIIPPAQTTLPADTNTTQAVPTTLAEGAVVAENATSFDPFGGGGENDAELPNLIDGEISTSWSTEQYEVPLQEVKQGVGVALTVAGTPSRVQIVGFTVGTRFEVYWSEHFFVQLEEWSRVAGGQAPPGATFVDLPPRNDGFWLLWFTDLPQRTDGTFQSSISEVRFLP